MSLAKVKLKQKIYENGKLLLPEITDISIDSGLVAGTKTISVAASASNTAIPISNRGTIEALYIWTNAETTYLTVKINGSNALNASDIMYTGAVSSLTVSNSNTTDAQNLNLLMVVS